MQDCAGLALKWLFHMQASVSARRLAVTTCSELCVPACSGGGEYGIAWREAGSCANKQNVFDDFIACAEFLQAEGYTSPGKLAIQVTHNFPKRPSLQAILARCCIDAVNSSNKRASQHAKVCGSARHAQNYCQHLTPEHCLPAAALTACAINGRAVRMAACSSRHAQTRCEHSCEMNGSKRHTGHSEDLTCV